MSSPVYCALFGLLTNATIILSPAHAVAAGTPEKPNIVFIITDDQRWDALGIAGSAVKTPNIDRLAREGQWYREATIQVPTCSASRAAILTGLPPAVNGWYSNQQVRQDVVSPNGFDQYKLLPKELAKAGYHTAFTGKWHIRPDPWLCGFEEIGHWMEAGAGAYKNARITFGRQRNSKKNPEFTQTLFADDAIKMLNKAASPETTQPLFLWLAYTAPHAPFGPNPEPTSGMYNDKKPRELEPPTYFGDAAKTKHGRLSWQSYYESITAVDAQIGRVMDAIRNSSLAKNTVVVVLGDNGFLMGSRGGKYGKYLPYEEAARVPLVMWGPEAVIGARGTTVTASVNSLDLSPTFVKLAGGTPPAEWAGRDVTAVMKDGQPHDITYAVSTYPDNSHMLDFVNAYHMIRTPKYKLIRWHPDNNIGPELYDLKKDPGETTNLYGKPEMKDAQAQLEKQLTDYEKATNQTDWKLKGPVIDHKAVLPDGTIAKNRNEANRIRKKLGLDSDNDE
jgi:arylsulfatase A-like enzyme